MSLSGFWRSSAARLPLPPAISQLGCQAPSDAFLACHSMLAGASASFRGAESSSDGGASCSKAYATSAAKPVAPAPSPTASTSGAPSPPSGASTPCTSTALDPAAGSPRNPSRGAPAALVLQPPGAIPARYVPWVPTRLLAKRNAHPRRMRFLMATLGLEAVAAARAAKPLPNFVPGDVLEVTVALPEAQHKEVLYKGVCIARYSRGIASAFKLYNAFADTGGVVQHFPIHMPDLIGVRVLRKVPAHRSKLYYLTEDDTSTMQFGAMTKAAPKAT